MKTLRYILSALALASLLPAQTTPASSTFRGPASATDNAVVRFDGTTGRLVQNSTALLGDTGAFTGVLSLTMTNGGAITDGGTGALTFTASGTNQSITVGPSGTGAVVLSGAGSAPGLFRLPTHTTAAGGIAFGGNTSLYTESAGILDLAHIGGTTPTLQFYEGSTRRAYIRTSGGAMDFGSVGSGSLTLFTNNTNALVIDTSQNTALVGNLSKSAASTFQISPASAQKLKLVTTSTGYTEVNGAAAGVLQWQVTGSTPFGQLLGGTDGVAIAGYNLTSGNGIQWSANTSTSYSEQMRLTTAGDLVLYTGGLTINNTASIRGVRTATATLDFPSTGAGAVADLTITVTGAAVGDTVSLGVPHGAVTSTADFFGWVSASDTVTVRFSPKATEDPASASFRATVVSF